MRVAMPHEDRPKDRPAEVPTLAKDDWCSEPVNEADVSSALSDSHRMAETSSGLGS
jgi:hypothetical protein